jgi:hypothetical protein
VARHAQVLLHAEKVFKGQAAARCILAAVQPVPPKGSTQPPP